MIKQNFTLHDIEQITGIQSATLRMWKKRYGILQPRKVYAKKMYYDIDDLKYLLNVKLLTDHGYRISQVLEMNLEEIHEKNRSLALERPYAYDGQLSNELLTSIMDLDEPGLERAYYRSVEAFGFINAMKKILLPLMVHMGNLWMTNTIRVLQEHFYSHFLRQKLMMATDLRLSVSDEKGILLFLPELELHDISLLFLNYLLRDAGYKTLYLGQSVPYSDLRLVLDSKGITIAVLNIAYTGNLDFHQAMLPNIVTSFPDVRFIMATCGVCYEIFRDIIKKKHLDNLELYDKMDEAGENIFSDL